MLFEANNDFIARRMYNSMDVKALPPGAKLEDFKLYKLGAFNRGGAVEKPVIIARPEALDVTFDRGDETLKDMFNKEHPEKEIT